MKKSWLLISGVVLLLVGVFIGIQAPRLGLIPPPRLGVLVIVIPEEGITEIGEKPGCWPYWPNNFPARKSLNKTYTDVDLYYGPSDVTFEEALNFVRQNGKYQKCLLWEQVFPTWTNAVSLLGHFPPE